MKVLHVYKRSWPKSIGGVEKFIHDLCISTMELGVQPTVFSLSPNPKDKKVFSADYEIIEAKENLYFASTGLSIEAFKTFKKLSENAEIVHYHFPNPFMDFLHYFSGLKIPCIVTYHSDIVRQKYLYHAYRPLMNCFLESVDHIVATSPNYLSTSKVLQRYANKTSVIPIGLDLDKNSINEAQKPGRFSKILPDKFFLFVGVLRYYKGVEYAIKAVEGTTHNLIIAGNGPLYKSFQKYIQRRGIHNVTMVGHVTESEKFYLINKSLAFVFPSISRAEAFGISQLEAAALGKPLINCELGTGTSYINIHEITGLVVPPKDIFALRKAMNAVANNNEIAKKYGAAARSRFKRHFKAEDQATAYTKLYCEMLNR